MEKLALRFGFAISASLLLLASCGGGGNDTPDSVADAVEVTSELGLPETVEKDVAGGTFVLPGAEKVERQFTAVLTLSSTLGTVARQFDLAARVGRGEPDGALSYAWQLDGGQVVGGGPATGDKLTVTFAKPGQYAVSVTLADAGGNQANAGGWIRIMSADPPAPVGDVNGDGAVNQDDIVLVDNWVIKGQELPPELFVRADLTLDGKVDAADLGLITAAAAAGESAPTFLWPAAGQLGTMVRIIDPSLLAPDGDALILFPGSPAMVPVRARPGYAAFVVPPEQSKPGMTTVTLQVDGTAVAEHGFQVIAPAAAGNDAQLLATLEKTELLLALLPGLVEGYAQALSLKAGERAALRGIAELAVQSWASNQALFGEVFEQMEAPAREAFGQVAQANGLADVAAGIAALEASLKQSSLPLGPSLLDGEQLQALTAILCAANDIAFLTSQAALVTGIASGYLAVFDGYPAEAVPMVAKVIEFLDDQAQVMAAVGALLATLTAYLPALGEPRVEVSSDQLQPGESAACEIAAWLELPPGLCQQAEAGTLPGLAGQLEAALVAQIASSIPLVGQAFQAADYARGQVDVVTGLLLQAVNSFVQELLTQLQVDALLTSLAGAICAQAEEARVALPGTVESSCGTVTAGSWPCAQACLGTIELSAEVELCSQSLTAVGELFCGACDPKKCAGCCAAEGCVAAADQDDQQCGLGGQPCIACTGHFDCTAGSCLCTSDCQTPGTKSCVGNEIHICAQVSANPPCNKLEFSEPCGEELVCNDGECIGQCSADNCSGCCLPDGTCLPGDQAAACGIGGVACQECTGHSAGCVEGDCSCVPDCQGKVCGDDGCGGSCGECAKPVCFGSDVVGETACEEGLCKPQVSKSCDDGNPCTVDSCQPEVGCISGNKPFGDCDDGDPCTVGDHCSDGQCLPGGGQIDCDDGEVCTTDKCDPATGCVHTSMVEGTACNDGNVCSIGDTCKGGVCAGSQQIVCNDYDPCTTDSCVPETGCQYISNSAPCDDGDLCTVGDKCLDGSCEGAPVACDDGNPCTDDSCKPALGCSHQPNNGACDDGDSCTIGDQCVDGSCAAGSSVSCDDANPCTTDSCQPGVGCVNAANNAPCDDGNLCSVGDKCKNGSCAAGASVNCDDGNACTNDSCTPLLGCVNAANNAPCNDGSLCTVGDHCANGSCQPGFEPKCDDDNPCTDDSCNPGTGGCQSINNSAPCDDGNQCSLGDQCAAGSCEAGSQSLACDDGNPCTKDSCDPAIGCQYVAQPGECDDGIDCTVGESCFSGSCGGCACTPGTKMKLDQLVDVQGEGDVQILPVNDIPIWQSYTAAKRGQLARVAFALRSGSPIPGNHVGRLDVFAGQGMGGKLLAQQNIIIPFSQQSVVLAEYVLETPVAQTPGTVYTVAITELNPNFGMYYVTAMFDAYLNGQSSGGAGKDIMVKTDVYECSNAPDCPDLPSFPTLLLASGLCDDGGDCTTDICTADGCENPNPACTLELAQCGSLFDTCEEMVDCGICAGGLACTDQNFCSDGQCGMKIGGSNINTFASGIFVADGYAYVADGHEANADQGLKIFSLLDGPNPILVGSAPTDGLATDVVVRDGYAYVVMNSESSFSVFDVSNPKAPALVGQSWDLPAADFVELGPSGIVFTMGNGSINIVDVTAPGDPLWTTEIESEGWAVRVKYHEGSLYAALTDRVARYVESPDGWAVQEVCTVAGGAFDLAVAGETLFVAGDTALLSIVNLTYSWPTPAPCPLISEVANEGQVKGSSIELGKGYAFITRSNGDHHLVDISDNGAPTPITSQPFASDGGGDSFYHRGRLYTASELDGLVVYDVSGCHCQNKPPTCGPMWAECGWMPDNCGGATSCGGCGDEFCVNNMCQKDWCAVHDMVYHFGTPGPAEAVALDGSYAYVADSSEWGGVLVFDISTPAQSKQINVISTGGSATRLEVFNHILFVGIGNGFEIWDVTDPNAPVKKSAVTTPAEVKQLVRSVDGYLYVANCENGFLTYDIQILTNPQPFDHLPTTHECAADILVQGELTIGLHTSGHIWLIDTSIPGVLTMDMDKEFYPGPSLGFFSLTMLDNYLYVGGGGGRLDYWLLDQPGDTGWELSPENSAVVTDDIRALSPFDGHIYTAESLTGFSVSRAYNPDSQSDFEVLNTSEFEGGEQALDLEVAYYYLFLAAGQGGFRIYSVKGCMGDGTAVTP